MARRIPYALAQRTARRIPGLRRLPVLKVLALAEVAMLARDHLSRLQPAQRRRLVELVRKGKGRPQNLSADERDELSALVARAQPRRFAALAADRLSPVPLPKRIVRAAAGRAGA